MATYYYSEGKTTQLRTNKSQLNTTLAIAVEQFGQCRIFSKLSITQVKYPRVYFRNNLKQKHPLSKSKI